MGRSARHAIELSDDQSLTALMAAEHKQLDQFGYPLDNHAEQFRIERGFLHRLVVNNLYGCTRFDVFAGAPSSGVQARVYAANGDLIACDGGAQHFPLLACVSGKIALVIETLGRGGPVAIEQRQEIIRNPVAASLPRATARLFQKAWNLGIIKSLGQFVNLESTMLADERTWERDITLAPDQCRVYFMALDGDAAGIDLRIVDSESEEIVSGEQHAEVAHVEICAPAGEKPHSYRLIATIQSGKSAALLSSIQDR